MTGESVLEQARASLEEGDLEGARQAFRRAVEEEPGNSAALVDLGYLSLRDGNDEEAADLFRRALEREPQNMDALRAIATIHGRAGRAEDAFEAAATVADARRDDPLAAIELAEVALDLGRLDEAAAAFQRLRSVDDDPSHEVYAYHGLIDVELRRENLRRALDLAVDATRVDRTGRTTDVLAYVVAQVFGGGDRPAPERADIDAALARSRDEHRRLHLEAW